MEELKGLFVVFSVQMFCLILFSRYLVSGNNIYNNNQLIALILFINVISFLSFNFWIFLFLLLVLFFYAKKNILDFPSSFLVMFCVAPYVSHALSGFGLVNKLLSVTPLVALSIASLPQLAKSGALKLRYGDKILLADLAVYAFTAILIVLSFRETSITNGLREALVRTLITLIPYLVISRSIRSTEQLKGLVYAYVLVMFGLSCVAIVESLWAWHFYAPILHNWEDGVVRRQYLFRAGFLRAYASVFNAISLGYVIAVAVPLFLGMNARRGMTLRDLAVLFVLLGGVGATLSRGPLLGALAMIAIFFSLKFQMVNRWAGVICFLGLASFVLLDAVDAGYFVQLIPIFGNVEIGTVDYRKELWVQSADLIWRYPLFGSDTFRLDLAERGMVQGRGIVDVVNTYISVMLNYGLIGLGAFLLVWTSVVIGLQRACNQTYRTRPELHHLCASLFSAVVGTLIIIATTSSIQHIPGVYWCLGGLSVALLRVVYAEQEQGIQRTAS